MGSLSLRGLFLREREGPLASFILELFGVEEEEEVEEEVVLVEELVGEVVLAAECSAESQILDLIL